MENPIDSDAEPHDEAGCDGGSGENFSNETPSTSFRYCACHDLLYVSESMVSFHLFTNKIVPASSGMVIRLVVMNMALHLLV